MTHVGVDVDFWRGLAGQPDKLVGVELADDHFAGLLHGPEGLGRALVVTVLHIFNLPEYLVRYAANLQKK